jgi:hypothetical protein
MGSLVNLLYAHHIRLALDAAGQSAAFERLRDPQVLMSGAAALPGDWLLLARAALAQAIGTGLSLCALAALLAVWLTWRLPQVDLHTRR